MIRKEVEGKKMQEGEKGENKQLIKTRKGKINQGGSVEKEHPKCAGHELQCAVPCPLNTPCSNPRCAVPSV